MTKKGEIVEWMSRIRHGSENPKDYSIIFRDFDDYIELPFQEFMERKHTDSIPLHRVSQIRKDNIQVFTRPNFCVQCGQPLQENVCRNPQCSKQIDI